MIFTVKEFRRNPFGIEKHPDNRDPNANYVWYVAKKGGDWCSGSGGRFSKYEPLLSYLNISDLCLLEGTDIEVPDNLNPNMSNALELFVLIARSGCERDFTFWKSAGTFKNKNWFTG